MVFSVFLDANILLDFTLQRQDYPDAKNIITKGIEGELHLYTTPAVLHIVSYWLTKSYKVATTKKLLLSLLKDVEIIDCGHNTAISAINSNMQDIEDALQYYTALKNKIGYFISSDKALKKAAIPELPVLTPRELISILDQ